MHAIDEVKRKIHLRSRDLVFNKGNLNLNNPSSILQSEDRSKEKIKEQKSAIYISLLLALGIAPKVVEG